MWILVAISIVIESALHGFQHVRIKNTQLETAKTKILKISQTVQKNPLLTAMLFGLYENACFLCVMKAIQRSTVPTNSIGKCLGFMCSEGNMARRS